MDLFSHPISLPIGFTPFPIDVNKPIPFGSSSGIIEDGSDGSFCDVKKGNCWWQH